VRIKIGRSYYHEGCLRESNPPPKKQELKYIPQRDPDENVREEFFDRSSTIDMLLRIILDRIKNGHFRFGLKTRKLAEEVYEIITGKR
jgi:hypothetical protein